MKFTGRFGLLDAYVDAAKIGIELKLPLADSIIYATGQRFDALIWTQDDDFKGLDGVEFSAKIMC